MNEKINRKLYDNRYYLENYSNTNTNILHDEYYCSQKFIIKPKYDYNNYNLIIINNKEV